MHRELHLNGMHLNESEAAYCKCIYYVSGTMCNKELQGLEQDTENNLERFDYGRYENNHTLRDHR